MPLPPAPAKRAALLSLDAMPVSTARGRSKAPSHAIPARATAKVEMTEKIGRPDPTDEDIVTDFTPLPRPPSRRPNARPAKAGPAMNSKSSCSCSTPTS